MKKFGILLVSMMMITAVAFAQKGKVKKESLTPDARASRNIEVMKKQLSLTDDQQVKIKQIILEKMVQLDAVKTKYQGNKTKERNQEIRDIRNNYMQSLKIILTPEQYGKWHDGNKIKKQKFKAGKKSGDVEEENEDIF